MMDTDLAYNFAIAHLATLRADIADLLATDFVAAVLLSHRIGRDAREAEAALLGTPDGEERAAKLRALKSYTGYGI